MTKRRSQKKAPRVTDYRNGRNLEPSDYQIKREKPIKPVTLAGKTENQKGHIRALYEHDQVLVFGPAGTGKTYVSATWAAKAFANKDFRKIVISRPMVSASEDEIGILPGDMDEKTHPWAIPILSTLEEHLGPENMDYYTSHRRKIIEVVPLATMRGRSFEESVVLFDEAQNATLQELRMLVTRIGEGSKLIITGDLRQTDLHEKSGLIQLIKIAKKNNIPINIIQYGLEDIVRGDICAQWEKAFYAEDQEEYNKQFS